MVYSIILSSILVDLRREKNVALYSVGWQFSSGQLVKADNIVATK